MNRQDFISWLHNYNNSKPSQALVMGILNITPNSFYDGGLYNNNIDSALYKVESMLAEGVDIIDVGGESTRPYGEKALVSLDEELDRVVPVIEAIRSRYDIAISIDTYKPKVMRAAIASGATMINDVHGLQKEESIKTLVDLQVPICITHNIHVHKKDIEQDTIEFFKNHIDKLSKAGILSKNIILDPGFGYSNNGLDGDLAIIHACKALSQYNLPVLLGVSRKLTIGKILNKSVDKRLYGSLALACVGLIYGVSIIRAHDIQATRDVVDIINRLLIDGKG